MIPSGHSYFSYFDELEQQIITLRSSLFDVCKFVGIAIAVFCIIKFILSRKPNFKKSKSETWELTEDEKQYIFEKEIQAS